VHAIPKYSTPCDTNDWLQGRTLKELAQQIAQLSTQVGQLLDEVGAARPAPHQPIQHLRSPSALCDAVRQIYRRAGLTPREIEVCALLIRGDADGEIAQALGTRLGTVKTHAARVCQKLNLDRKRIPWDFFVRLSSGHENNGSYQPDVEEYPLLSRRPGLLTTRMIVE
jgi:DNA-binding CsgD family transcriptional regulator